MGGGVIKFVGFGIDEGKMFVMIILTENLRQ